MSSGNPQVTIVGAGIIGLYTAYVLTEIKKIPGSEICVVAKYLPGDQSASGYTSPWAGGNWSCISPNDAGTLFYDKFTYENLTRLQDDLLAFFAGKDGEWLGLSRRPSREFWDYIPDSRKIESLKSYLEDYKVLSKAELSQIKPTAPAFGISLKTWNFNCPVFLYNFFQFLQGKHQVRFVKQELTHLAQAKSFVNPLSIGSDKHIIFNCTGLGARDLGGVRDHKVYPTRGQVVVVKAPHINENCLRWGKDYATYIIPRPGKGKELVLGGFLQVDNGNAQDTSHAESEDILKRTLTLLPKIGKPEELEIMRVAAGLRPSRYGGPRIEKEIKSDDDNLIIIHNYGASGYGYQGGLGMGFEAVQLAFPHERGSKL